jgi:hypothetical protein
MMPSGKVILRFQEVERLRLTDHVRLLSLQLGLLPKDQECLYNWIYYVISHFIVDILYLIY